MMQKNLILLNLDEAVVNLLIEFPTWNNIKLDNLGEKSGVFEVKKSNPGINFVNLCLKN